MKVALRLDFEVDVASDVVSNTAALTKYICDTYRHEIEAGVKLVENDGISFGRFRGVDARCTDGVFNETGIPFLKHMKKLFENEMETVKYLIDEGVVDVIETCPRCGSGVSWHRRWPVKLDGPMHYNCFMRRCKNVRCRFQKSIFSGTVLQGFSHPKNQFLHFVYLWLCGDSTLSIRTKLGWTADNVRQWALYMREVCMLSVQAAQAEKKIGGPGIEVQIDESKFGKRKYHRGHHVEGTWVFGGVEILHDDAGRPYAGNCFAVSVVDRKRETLLPLLEKYVAAGSHISSDDWRAYWAIEDLCDRKGDQKYTHDIVVHERGFKNPITGTHTNVIEGQWRWMKQSVPHRFYYDGDKVQTCLYKYMWDQRAKRHRWKTFISDMAKVRFEN
jgi:hypothetical protein